MFLIRYCASVAVKPLVPIRPLQRGMTKIYQTHQPKGTSYSHILLHPTWYPTYFIGMTAYFTEYVLSGGLLTLLCSMMSYHLSQSSLEYSQRKAISLEVSQDMKTYEFKIPKNMENAELAQSFQKQKQENGPKGQQAARKILEDTKSSQICITVSLDQIDTTYLVEKKLAELLIGGPSSKLEDKQFLEREGDTPRSQVVFFFKSTKQYTNRMIIVDIEADTLHKYTDYLFAIGSRQKIILTKSSVP